MIPTLISGWTSQPQNSKVIFRRGKDRFGESLIVLRSSRFFGEDTRSSRISSCTWAYTVCIPSRVTDFCVHHATGWSCWSILRRRVFSPIFNSFPQHFTSFLFFSTTLQINSSEPFIKLDTFSSIRRPCEKTLPSTSTTHNHEGRAAVYSRRLWPTTVL